MTRRMHSRRVAFTAATFMLVATGVIGCGTEEDDPNEDGVFYCTDANGVVVDENLCDDSSGAGNSSDGGGGFFFAYMGSSLHTSGGHSGPYRPGQRLPSGHQKFSISDKASRAKFGLPSSGKISNGTVKTGVVGKGGPGSTAKVGGGSRGGGVGGGKGSSGG
jgi:hypothetical protein